MTAVLGAQARNVETWFTLGRDTFTLLQTLSGAMCVPVPCKRGFVIREEQPRIRSNLAETAVSRTVAHRGELRGAMMHVAMTFHHLARRLCI